jgi:type IV pilus assembly protein PilM
MIIGLDIGTYSVKAVVLDPKKRYQLVQYSERRIEAIAKAAPAPAPAAKPQGPPPTPEDAAHEDGPTEWAEPEEDTGEWDAPEEEGAEDGVAAEAGAIMGEEKLWLMAVQRIMGDLPQSDTIITSLPWGKAVTLTMDLPFGDRAQVEKILPPQLDQRLPFSPREVCYDFLIQSEEERHEAYVGFARKRELGEFLEDLKGVGVNPMIVGVPEMMLRYVAEAHVPDYQEETFALVDMGHETTRVLVVQNGRVVLSRAMNVGGLDVTRAIAEVFQCSEEEAAPVKHAQAAILAPGETQDPSREALSRTVVSALEPLVRDLRRSFKALYAKDRVELEKIYITGGASRVGNITRYLTQEFGGVPVSALQISADVSPEQPLGDDALSKMPLAYSHALQQYRDRTRQRLLDLRQEEFAYRGRSSYLRAQLMRLAAAAAVLLVLLAGALFMKKRDLNAQRDAMRAAVGKETKKVFGSPVWRAADIKSRAESEEEGEGGFVPKMSAYEVFYQLSDKLSADTQLELTRIEVDSDRNLIQVYGKTNTPQAVDKIVSDLEKLECLKSIKKDKLQVRSESEVDFELQIASACS